MKKYIKSAVFMLLMIVGVVAFQSCDKDDDKNINSSELPTAAQTFISQYFPHYSIISCEKDKDNGETAYEVILDNGTEIDFDKSGTWINVDCHLTALPMGIVPIDIASDIATRYPDIISNQIEKEVLGYYITLSNNLTLIYSYDGTYIKTTID